MQKPDIMPLSALLGQDLSRPAEMPKITGIIVKHEPPQPWDTYEMPPAPSTLAPVKLPVAHLSIQIAWMHRLIAEQRARVRKSYYARERRKARARKVKRGLKPEEILLLRERRREYMARYRARRALAKKALRERTMSPAERIELERHRERVRKLRKNKADQKRRFLAKQYRAAILRDNERFRQQVLEEMRREREAKDKTP